MLAPMYYVVINYHNTIGRKNFAEVIAGPFFKYREAEDYRDNNFTYEGKLQVMKDNSVDLQPAYD